jgi:glycosyltransferase involved in cell wall biosynthesis
MKVLHVARRQPHSAHDAADTCVRAIARSQCERGDDAQILRAADSDAPVSARANDVTVVSVRRVGSRGAEGRALPEPPGEDVTAAGLLRALLAGRGVEVFHCHAARVLGATVRSAAVRRRVPYVLHLHAGDESWPEGGTDGATPETVLGGGLGRLKSAFLGTGRVLTDAALVLVTSVPERDRILAKNPRGRVEVLPEGVDAARFRGGNRARGRLRLGLPAEAPVLLTIAPIDPKQNQEALVDILAAARSAHAVLAGPLGASGYDDRIRIRARAFGVEERVHFASGAHAAGHDVPDLLAAADAFVLPSALGPDRFVLLQAWAAGLPVVAASAAGLADLVNGDTGLIVAAGDAKALAAGVTRVLSDETLRGGLAGRGVRLVATRYDWAAVTARLDVLYREAGAGKPG